MADFNGFNVGNPIIVVDETDELCGKEGVIVEYSPSNAYWCKIDGYTGCFKLYPKQIELNVKCNILEMVVAKGCELPKELLSVLQYAKLEIIPGKHFSIYRYNLQRKTWKELATALDVAKNVTDDIIDYEVDYNA